MQVSGFKVGKVNVIELDGPRVLVTFTVDKNIRLGDRTEAAIKTKGLLGTKILEAHPPRRRQQSEPDSARAHHVALPAARRARRSGARTISGLNTNQLSESLRVLADTFADTPPSWRSRSRVSPRFSQTLNDRDAQLRNLLANANKATTVLAERSDQIVSLVGDTNALLVELQSQRDALDQISGNISALSQQLKGFISENRDTSSPRSTSSTGC